MKTSSGVQGGTRNWLRGGEPWDGDRSRGASVGIAGLHLLAASGFAVAQPLYDIVGRSAPFLVAHQARALDIVAIVLVLSALLPLALLGTEVLASLVARRASLWLHRGLMGLLFGGFALQAMRRAPLPGWLLVAIALVFGSSGAAVYCRRAGLRRFVTVLSPAVLVFPLYFLFGTPVASLFSSEEVSPRVALRDGPSTPVVMVVFDEFSAFSIMDASQRIDSLRYPHLAALAADAHWFRNATSVSSDTSYAVPAILSGRYRREPLLPTAADYPQTLLTLLGGSHELRVFESFTSLCPEELCGGQSRAPFGERIGAILRDLSIVYCHVLLPADLAAGLPSIAATWREFGGRERTDAEIGLEGAPPEFFPRTSGQFERFLEALRSGRDSTLYLIHMVLPHVPWKFLPSGKQYGPETMRMHPYGVDKTSEQWGDDEWPIVLAFQRYLLQVGYVDRLIGEITATLKEAGLYESCLLVVVADHGVSFRPGDNRRKFTETNFTESANVPLLVKLPGQRQGAISDRDVQTIDILPTIADALDLEIPWPVDGRSALDPTSADEPEKSPRRPFVFDAERLSARRESVERMLALFGSGSDPDALFRIGPRPQLLGRTVDDRIVAARSPLLVDLDGVPRSTWHYDPQGAVAPTHFTGRVTGQGADDPPLELAVAVNGVVRAVTRTFDRGQQRARFSAMVPESALVPGPNRVELFVVSETDGRTLLSPAPTVNDVFSLGKLANGDEALFRDGQAIAVVAGEVTGSVELVQRLTDGWATFKGWAADLTAGGAADRIVVFAGERLADARPPRQDRPDIVRRFSRQGILRSGFDIELPPRFFPDERSYPAVRIFAVSQRGVASELALPKGPGKR